MHGGSYADDHCELGWFEFDKCYDVELVLMQRELQNKYRDIASLKQDIQDYIGSHSVREDRDWYKNSGESAVVTKEESYDWLGITEKEK